MILFFVHSCYVLCFLCVDIELHDPCMCPFLHSTYGRNRATIQNVRNSCIEIMHEDDEPEEMNIKRLSSFSLANLLKE